MSCGYDKHVEVCHIKPISEYDLDIKVSEINHKSNIHILCPNCHWEFDNGFRIVSSNPSRGSIAFLKIFSLYLTFLKKKNNFDFNIIKINGI